MPDLSEVLSAVEETDITVKGIDIHVSFDPNYLTPALEEAVSKAKAEKTARVLATIVSEMVVEWDLTKGGEPFEPSEENCMGLPMLFLADVINGLADASKPDEEEGNS